MPSPSWVLPGWHRHPLSGAPPPLWRWLARGREEGAGWCLGRGTAIACPVAPPPLWCCPPDSISEQLQWRWSPLVTVYTAMVWAVHRGVLSGATAPFFPRVGSSWGWPGRSPPPLSGDQRLVSSHWNSTIGRGTAVSGALAETSSFAPTALFSLWAINRGGARAWAGC
jgi:hypothetical protein